MELLAPMITADSLVGTPKGDSVRVAIPLSEVLLVEVGQRWSETSGPFIAVSIVLLVGALLYLMVNSIEVMPPD
jgi:hypothetical protein